MKTINYITNLDVAQFSGGWSALNHHVYHQLNKAFNINLIHKVDPPYPIVNKLQSKILRSIQLKGSFPAFTNQRLTTISQMVRDQLKPADINFFHGTTPWLNVEHSIPYAAYLDAAFASYIKIYHKEGAFNKKQIDLILRKETQFLRNAQAILFSSAWALNQTKAEYGLDGHNFYFAGLGAGFVPVEKDAISNDPYFLFVGNDFIGKGGEVVVNVFKQFKTKFPQYKLKIVGEKPPKSLLQINGVEYLGYIDRSEIQEAKKLSHLFRNAFGLLLPTTKDITPLVLIEAGSVGCPVISTRAFGIPEIVKHDITGILIDSYDRIEKHLLDAMCTLSCDISLRDRLGENARQHIAANFTWDKTGENIIQALATTLR